MAQGLRSPKLENRTNRLKLPRAKKPVFVRIDDGLSLGYRRNATAGTWVMKIPNGKGGATTRTIGTADDYEEADGSGVLTWWQAQQRARELASRPAGESEGPRKAPMMVSDAVEAYLDWLETKNPRSAKDTRQRLAKHFLPEFGNKMVVDLSKTALERWHGSMVRTDGDADDMRRSRDSANRVLSMLKAALNRAFQDPKNGIGDDTAWRLVKPFRAVDAAREVHFSSEQAQALIAAAPTPEFADLLTAAFLTGARYGELCALNVRHFDGNTGTLTIPRGKTGSRVVILHSEAIDFFGRIAAERQKDAPLLPRPDGGRWGVSHQVRPMRVALEAAGLPADGTFYALRHSYISRAIEAQVPLTILAENCGTSVRMIERNYAKMIAEKRRDFIERGAPRLTGLT